MSTNQGRINQRNGQNRAERKSSLRFVYQHIPAKPIHHTCTRSRTTLNSPPPCIPRIARRTIPFRPVPRPSRHRKIDKSSPSPACFSYVSIHTTCQPIVNHYCTFFAFMIFYTLLFLIIFFCSLILDVPCLYHQPTAKLPISSLPPLFLSFSPFLIQISSLSTFSLALSPLAGYFPLVSLLSFSLPLSLSLAVYK